ncbi:hypothetical protein PAXRUDRAFT_15594 [Paxillus rubicundulus Ve08.2h10]|uniref:F-box domain-containing protein n=1 Tax=Paxillus rubicundulus Ve08.2h10 TaxID=930991 RepID=A0A0D0DH97_9AGAM|nr:hypothetical protein PAXRUDRAFT_15594 [Paxillus rubicundulus Ve08.2h10]
MIQPITHSQNTSVWNPPPSTPERPSVKSSIQHPLKHKLDKYLANHAVTKCQHVSTAQGVESEPLKKSPTLKHCCGNEAEVLTPSKQAHTAPPPSILQLPNELLHKIIGYVPMEGLKAFTQTSSLFKEIAAPHYLVEVDFKYEEANMVDTMSKMKLQEHHSANLEERIPSTKEEALEEIVQGIFRITLQDVTPNPVQPMPSTAAHKNKDFTMLVSLDHELHTRATHALELVKDLDSQGVQSRVLDAMREEELWLEGVQKKLETIGIMDDERNEMLQVAMMEKVDQILAAIKSVSMTLAPRTKEDPLPEDHASATVETGS